MIEQGRLTDRVEFVLPMDQEAFRRDSESPPPDATDAWEPTPRPSEELEQVANAALGVDRYRYHGVSVGRGAEGIGLALEVLGVVSDAGGAAVVAVWLSRQVRSAWQRFRHSGFHPQISLGAAVYLAAADLSDRLGLSDEEITVVARGDADPSSPDRSYTGFDNFWVVLSANGKLHVCLVSATGDVDYLGGARPRSRDVRSDQS